MRVLLRASSLALAASLIVAGAAAAQAQAGPAAPAKIAYINSAQLLAQAPGRAEAEAQFDREVGVYRQQIQRMDDSLRTLVAAFEREAPKLDSAARETRRRSVGQREAESDSLALRIRGAGKKQEVVRVDDFIAQVTREVRDRSLAP